MKMKIFKILSEDQESFDGLPESFKVDDLVYFKYAPLTLVNVERSFLTYKNVLTIKRCVLIFKNIEKCLAVQWQRY